MDLFYSSSPNVLKVMIALEELALPYRLIFVDLSQGRQHDPENLGGAPNSKVPVLRDTEPLDGGEPAVVFESGAILQYLAEKTGRLMSTDPRERSQTMQWLFWQMSTLGPAGGNHFHFKAYAARVAPDTNFDYPRSRFLHMLEAAWKILDRRLATSEFLVADFSVADIACYPWLRSVSPQNVEAFPNLIRWRDQIASRPALVAAIRKNTEFDVGYSRTPTGAIEYPFDGLRQHFLVA